MEKKKQEAIAAKAISDKKLQDDLDEKDRLDALAKQGDQAVWNDFISRLKAIDFPVMQSKDFKDKVGSVRDFISNLK